MYRDMLGNRVKNHNHLKKQELMERYYIFNNKVFQIIRAGNSCKLDGGMCYSFTVQNIKTKKIIFKEFIWAKEFEEMVFFKTKNQALKELQDYTEFQYNYCYFPGNNTEIVNVLHDLGYIENYSNLNTSYIEYPMTIIKKGKMITRSTIDFKGEGKYYRHIRLVDNKIVISESLHSRSQ